MLDRAPARSLRVTGIGVEVELRLGGERADELREHLVRVWSRCLGVSATRSGPPVRAVLTDPTTEPRARHILAAADPDALLTRITRAVTIRVIKAQAGHLLMLHAGAVCNPESGAGLVFVAPGGTGKTTLARTLARDHGYLTDETVGIDRAGRLHPYPKPLSIRTEATSLRKHEVSPDELCLRKAHPEPHVARIILLNRNDGRAAPVIDELPLLEAVAALAPETSSLSSLDRGLAFCADLLARTGPVLRVRYGEASSLVDLAEELIGRAR